MDNDLHNMGRLDLIREVVKLRTAIRYARDQANDEKCWLDFFRLFEMLPEGVRANDQMLSKEQMMGNCSTFIDCMKCYLSCPGKTVDEIYAIWQQTKPY